MGRGHQVHWRYSGLIRGKPTKEGLFPDKVGVAVLIDVLRSIGNPTEEASSCI
jgi:hypothetical protein